MPVPWIAYSQAAQSTWGYAGGEQYHIWFLSIPKSCRQKGIDGAKVLPPTVLQSDSLLWRGVWPSGLISKAHTLARTDFPTQKDKTLIFQSITSRDRHKTPTCFGQWEQSPCFPFSDVLKWFNYREMLPLHMGRKPVLTEHETVVKWKVHPGVFLKGLTTLSLTLASPFVPRAALGKSILGRMLWWEGNWTYHAPYLFPLCAIATATEQGRLHPQKEVRLLLTVQLRGVRVQD